MKLRKLIPSRDLILVGVSFFALGAGASLAYVLSGALQVEVENKYICVFKTPEGWIWPEAS